MDKPDIKPVDVQPSEVGQQLRYPLDYTTQRILEEFSRRPAFPVGAIFITVDSTNPATTLGYGTWSAFGAGRTLVGLDSGQTEFDTVEETGGAKTHTLTTAEMPAHTHTIPIGGNGGASVGAQDINNPSSSATSGSTGGGGSHNNLQPYIVCYFWKRTA